MHNFSKLKDALIKEEADFQFRNRLLLCFKRYNKSSQLYAVS